MKVIEVKDLSFSFGKHHIFKELNLSLDSGEIVGIIGKNGSGKSALFKLIAGLIKPKKGEVWVNGVEIGNSTKFAENIGVLSEEPSFLPELTAFDNLALLLSINQKVSKEVVEKTLDAKEDLLRLAEKLIEEIPDYLLGIAALMTAINTSKQKKRKPKPRKHK
ncbi:ATP-binding cassette domain-containing protein [Streptococcus sp. S784/96/1]|uniref:ATP-binding cassette domain-containing protein n=1 Tax=Streptococcus sp. S784/96/1 TaxID=2653499 RepID=UPI0013866965|nr:ATP-binding cassette domain-containing protein [Streptococcus sp. S784/96/1]